VKHTVARETKDARYDHLILGEVVENVDPEGLGRVRVFAPAYLEPESKWAFPIGHMFGVQNGIHWVPEIGSNVVVFLNQGDADHPYYAAGPPGKPDGVSDVPEQAPSGSVDHMVIRWRGFHLTINGKSGEERLTIEDLESETKIEIDRTTKDYTRLVKGDEHVTVEKNRDVTVVTGDEVHAVTVGKRTTTVQGDDVKTIVAGNKVDTVTAGNEVKTLTAGGSTETMAAGAKTVTALSVAITGTASVALTSGAVINLTAPAVNLLTALLFLGGPLGLPLMNNLLLAWANSHTHSSSGAGAPNEQIIPGGTTPNFDSNLLATTATKAL